MPVTTQQQKPESGGTMFSDEQWRFLAVVDILGESALLDVVGEVVPLKPGPLFMLLDTAKDMGWLKQDAAHRLGLTKDVPAWALDKMREIGRNEDLGSVLDKLCDLGAEKQLSSRDYLDLLRRCGRHEGLAEALLGQAYESLVDKDYHSAWDGLASALDTIRTHLDANRMTSEFISGALDFSNLSFLLGKGFAKLPELLLRAQELSALLGDQRSHALINLHLGRIFYFSNRRKDALLALNVGLTEVEDLGDYEMKCRAAEFLGLCYYMQGMFREARTHLERADELYGNPGPFTVPAPMAPLLLGYCLIYLGEMHQALGSLDCNWRLAMERGEHALASALRSTLGTLLVLLNKKREAKVHLEAALEQATSIGSDLTQYLISGGIAMGHMLDGEATKARQVLEKSFRRSAEIGMARQYSSPWILEMTFKMERLGLPPVKNHGFSEAVEQIWQEENVHLKGVALRLQAKLAQEGGRKPEAITAMFEKSMEYLQCSGDSVQLAKTLLAMARHQKSMGRGDEARTLAKRAWNTLGGYAEAFFPDDMRPLLEQRDLSESKEAGKRDFLNRYLALMESLLPLEDQEEILYKTVAATNRLFGAERGALFWFPGGKPTDTPLIRATANLTKGEVSGDDFKDLLDLVIRSFRENRPILTRFHHGAPAGNIRHKVAAAVCLPITVGNGLRGVLYHDNTFMDDCFDFLDEALIQRLVGHISSYVERIINESLQAQKSVALGPDVSLCASHNDGENLVFRSSVMQRLIGQVDKAAAADSSILILGETGVGKELLARRIHANSGRGEGAFVVVDATTIPESLFESELFGHEKGSFTGADRQKRGRLELADGGTLFIDEVGELPLSTQAKFLRALQEKSFSRVGGLRSINSDFRLVAATNRDLAAQVSAGRFREDLYYRLNVVPVTLPPLRERKEDIAYLAQFFLQRYAKKYNRADLLLFPEQQAKLEGYFWPGNVRELENVMERAVLLSADRLEVNLPLDVGPKADSPFDGRPTLDEMQRTYIRQVLNSTNGKMGGPGGAAEILGMKRTSLYSRMRALGMLSQ